MSNTRAKRNIPVVFDGQPYVHLKGHCSQHFDIRRMQYVYVSASQCASEKEFKTACEDCGCVCCDLFKDNIYIRGKHHQIFITSDGIVLIDGKTFTVHDQKAAEKAKNKPSSERKEKNHEHRTQQPDKRTGTEYDKPHQCPLTEPELLSEQTI